MALFFSTTLVISIVGLAGLFTIKGWENRSGRVMFPRVRPTLGAFFHSVLVWLERVAPVLLTEYAYRAVRTVRAALQRFVAWAILLLEHALERTLHMVRYTTLPPPGNGEVSAFLREVAEHKKTLVKRSKKEHTVVQK